MPAQTIPGADALDMKYIDKLGVEVTTSGDRYVVRDPTRKRAKYEGGNLRALLVQCERERNEEIAAEAEKKAGKHKPKANGAKLPGVDTEAAAAKIAARKAKGEAEHRGKTIAEAVAESPKNDPNDEDPDQDDRGETEVDDNENFPEDGGVTAAFTKKPETPKRPRGKRSETDWKTYRVGMMILKNSEKTPGEVFDMCMAEGIETKEQTVIGLNRYINLTIRLLADLAKERKGDEK